MYNSSEEAKKLENFEFLIKCFFFNYSRNIVFKQYLLMLQHAIIMISMHCFIQFISYRKKIFLSLRRMRVQHPSQLVCCIISVSKQLKCSNLKWPCRPRLIRKKYVKCDFSSLTFILKGVNSIPFFTVDDGEDQCIVALI